MRVAKIAVDQARWRRPSHFFSSARAAFKTFLASCEFDLHDCVLVPAYIGWSAREGSGVFDPIRELGLKHRFYRVDSRLNVDVADFERCLRSGGVRVVLLIHYFGRVDPHAAHLAALARRAGALLVEDSAHAMLTDLASGMAGSFGEVSIFSLHKLLPVTDGGMLVVNAPDVSQSLRPGEAAGLSLTPWDFDLQSISRRRRSNAAFLDSRLRELEDEVQPLWGSGEIAYVPQTYPVLITRRHRDAVYHEMNQRGYGVVSLYHTLIDEIREADFPVSHAISQRILNLPVHQDVNPDALQSLLAALKDVLRTVSVAA